MTTASPDIERREAAARKLCRRLTDDVARIAPPGLGTEPWAWRLVTSASDRFLDLLHEWERTGDRGTLLDELRVAYYAVVDAWRTAAARHGSATRA